MQPAANATRKGRVTVAFLTSWWHVESNSESSEPWTSIRPAKGLARFNFREMLAFRDICRLFVERELKLRYKQTFFGVAWTLLQPLTAMAVFAVVFGRLAGLP